MCEFSVLQLLALNNSGVQEHRNCNKTYQLVNLLDCSKLGRGKVAREGFGNLGYLTNKASNDQRAITRQNDSAL